MSKKTKTKRPRARATRELYRLKLRERPIGYAIGRLLGKDIYTVACPRCAGNSFLWPTGKHVWLHEIRYTQAKIGVTTVNAYGSLVLDVSDACTREGKVRVRLTLRESV